MNPQSAEVWRLIDRRTGRQLGAKVYSTLAEAAKVRARLVRLAAGVSPECGYDVEWRADVRREPRA